MLVPTSDDDVRAAFDVCRELGVPMLPRGAGSSQCGQTVGAALVIDHSKHLNRVLYLDRKALTAIVEPGVVLDQLNAYLKPHGVWFPVDVSTSAQATLGGMAGNNSCGSRSIAYGNMVHNVVAIEALLADGTTARFGPELEMQGAPTRVRTLLDGLRAIGARERDEIESRVPTLLRRVGGYNIDVFHPQSVRPYTADGSVNFAHLLVGSEGTLAWTRRLTVQLAPLPGHRTLGVVNFPSLHRAMESAAPYRHAGAIGGRTGRPDDDRPRARKSRVCARDRRRARWGTPGDPAGRVHRRHGGRPAAPSCGSGRADGRRRTAGQRRAHRRCRRAEGIVGSAQGRPQHHDEHARRRQARVVHRGLRGAARAPRRICRPVERGVSQARDARHVVRARVRGHAARAPDPRHAPGRRGEDARDRRRGRGAGARVQGRLFRRARRRSGAQRMGGMAVRPAAHARFRGDQGAVRSRRDS